MNILIVDDDAYVIEALQKGIDWNQLGMEQVYTAYNVKHAKKILEDCVIHILLCDIEMPKESGLSLLKWVREQKFIIQNIFLTSYGDFEYASQAIELQTFSYALKPIAYDKLKDIIRNAVEKEKQALKALDYQKGYESWVDTVRNRKESFWTKLLVEKSIAGEDNITRFCGEMDIEYRQDSEFLCVQVEFFYYKEVTGQVPEDMINWLLNTAGELLGKEGIKTESLVKKDNMVWLLILSLTRDSFPEGVKRASSALIKCIGTHLHCQACVGIGNICKLNELPDHLIQIEKMCMDNVVRNNKTLLLDEYEYKTITYTPPNFDIWETLMTEAKGEECIRVMNEYLDRLVSKNRVNKEVLYRFRMDFSQVMFSVLRKHHIMLHACQYQRLQEDAGAEAILSIDHMRNYLENLIQDTVWIIGGENKTKTVVEMVTDYIEHNIEKEISRETLAEMVYLNPDYLARVFKKEKGESIGTYLVSRRIGLAKEYFENTNEPIHAVALKVGYDNFSYFSKVFKDVTGLTPKEYKKRMTKK